MNHYEFCGTAVPLGRIDELFCDMSGDVFLRENAGVPGAYEHHVHITITAAFPAIAVN